MTTVETATYGVTLYDGEDANGLANIVGMLLEIVDSRIAGWDITLGDTIADNASCGLYVLGDVQPRQSLPDLTTITMTMTENGTLASRGVGADCLGSPCVNGHRDVPALGQVKVPASWGVRGWDQGRSPRSCRAWRIR
ncbi:2-keto-4-pentenoate hydratase (plasmid) [Rhodococcus sp. WAY2]|nr:2-keto-4-pentenoate hydratase [Rhodococcus sp. WAY2]